MSGNSRGRGQTLRHKKPNEQWEETLVSSEGVYGLKLAPLGCIR